MVISHVIILLCLVGLLKFIVCGDFLVSIPFPVWRSGCILALECGSFAILVFLGDIAKLYIEILLCYSIIIIYIDVWEDC